MHRKNGEPYSYFQCYGYSKGKCSKSNSVSSLVLEKEVLKLLKEAIDDQDVNFELKHREPVEVKNESSLIEERIKSLELKERRIKASYREGIDTLEEYKENKKLIQEERERLEAQLAELKKSNTVTSTEDVSRKMLQNISSVYNVLISENYTTSQKNDSLRQIVDKIIYDRRNDTLKIYYYYYL